MLTSYFHTRTSFSIKAASRPGKPSRDVSHVEQVAYIITDDKRLGADLVTFVEANHIRAKWFTSASDYLSYKRPDLASCLILSRRLSDGPHLDVLGLLTGMVVPPIIVLSDAGDIPSCVSAIRKGAHDFLTLPLMANRLQEALSTAFKKDEAAIALRHEHEALRQRWRSLTSREAEVMRYVVDGFLNKQTAAELRITENTVQVHRGRVMRKMEADSFAALVRMSLKLAGWNENSLLYGVEDRALKPSSPFHRDSVTPLAAVGY